MPSDTDDQQDETVLPATRRRRSAESGELVGCEAAAEMACEEAVHGFTVVRVAYHAELADNARLILRISC